MAKIKTCPKPTKKKKRPTITQLKKTLCGTLKGYYEKD